MQQTSLDVDIDANRHKQIKVFEKWIWRRMEEISWLEKVTNEEVLGRVNEDRQIFGKGNNDGLAMF